MPSTSAQAKARGSSLYAAKDYAGAARCFGEAIAAAGPADDAELHLSLIHI